MPPETSSTAFPWHSPEGELLGSDPHTWGLLQQQPGEPGGLFFLFPAGEWEDGSTWLERGAPLSQGPVPVQPQLQ